MAELVLGAAERNGNFLTWRDSDGLGGMAVPGVFLADGEPALLTEFEVFSGSSSWGGGFTFSRLVPTVTVNGRSVTSANLGDNRLWYRERFSAFGSYFDWEEASGGTATLGGAVQRAQFFVGTEAPSGNEDDAFPSSGVRLPTSSTITYNAPGFTASPSLRTDLVDVSNVFTLRLPAWNASVVLPGSSDGSWFAFDETVRAAIESLLNVYSFASAADLAGITLTLFTPRVDLDTSAQVLPHVEFYSGGGGIRFAYDSPSANVPNVRFVYSLTLIGRFEITRQGSVVAISRRSLDEITYRQLAQAFNASSATDPAESFPGITATVIADATLAFISVDRNRLTYENGIGTFSPLPLVFSSDEPSIETRQGGEALSISQTDAPQTSEQDFSLVRWGFFGTIPGEAELPAFSAASDTADFWGWQALAGLAAAGPNPSAGIVQTAILYPTVIIDTANLARFVGFGTRDVWAQSGRVQGDGTINWFGWSRIASDNESESYAGTGSDIRVRWRVGETGPPFPGAGHQFDGTAARYVERVDIDLAGLAATEGPPWTQGPANVPGSITVWFGAGRALALNRRDIPAEYVLEIRPLGAPAPEPRPPAPPSDIFFRPILVSNDEGSVTVQAPKNMGLAYGFSGPGRNDRDPSPEAGTLPFDSSFHISRENPDADPTDLRDVTLRNSAINRERRRIPIWGNIRLIRDVTATAPAITVSAVDATTHGHNALAGLAVTAPGITASDVGATTHGHNAVAIDGPTDAATSVAAVEAVIHGHNAVAIDGLTDSETAVNAFSLGDWAYITAAGTAVESGAFAGTGLVQIISLERIVLAFRRATSRRTAAAAVAAFRYFYADLSVPQITSRVTTAPEQFDIGNWRPGIPERLAGIYVHPGAARLRVEMDPATSDGGRVINPNEVIYEYSIDNGPWEEFEVQ